MRRLDSHLLSDTSSVHVVINVLPASPADLSIILEAVHRRPEAHRISGLLSLEASSMRVMSTACHMVILRPTTTTLSLRDRR